MQCNDTEVQACLVTVYAYPPVRDILGGLNEELVLLDVCEFHASSPTEPVGVDHALYRLPLYADYHLNPRIFLSQGELYR